MSKARVLANLISDNAELADGQISVAEVVGAAPTANPTFTGTVNADAITMSGFLTVNGGADFNTVLYPDGIAMADSRTISFGTSADFELNGGSTFLDFNLKDNARHLRIKNGLVEHHRFSGNGSVIFNESGADADFRIESNSNEHMLFVNGGTNQIGVGTSSPNATFGVLATDDAQPTLRLASSGANGTDASIRFQAKDSGGNPRYADILFDADRSTGAIKFYTDYAFAADDEIATFDDNGAVFNESGASGKDFRVESDNNANMLFVDAGNDRIGVGTSNPLAVLDIQGNTNAYSTMSKIYLTDVSGHANSRNWSIGNGGSHYGSFTVGVSNAAGGDPQASGTHFNPFLITQEGNVVFNDDSKDADFRVESDSNTHALFVDASGGAGGDILFGVSSRTGMYNGTGANGVAIESLGDQGTALVVQSSTNACVYLANPSGNSNDNFIVFSDAGATVGQISGTSSGTTYSTSSDRRLKDNIEPIADATDKLMSMKPVTHTWIANPEAPSVHGFIAQEMQEIIPEAVSGEDGGEEMMSMDYGRITPVLVAALQEATNEIKALKQRVSELEAI